MSEKENEEFIARLNFPKNLARVMRQTLQLRQEIHELENPKLELSNIYRLLRGYSTAAIQTNAIAVHSSVASKHLNLYLNKLRYVKTLLNGQDLIKMGIPAGPKVGEILDALQKARLDGKVRTRKDEEGLVHKGIPL